VQKVFLDFDLIDFIKEGIFLSHAIATDGVIS
jgi:hypothetical protein